MGAKRALYRSRWPSIPRAEGGIIASIPDRYLGPRLRYERMLSTAGQRRTRAVVPPASSDHQAIATAPAEWLWHKDHCRTS
jgi:hypothetical protein